MIQLILTNANATPRQTIVNCDGASVAPIMAWYAAYNSGDRYMVTRDGRSMPVDANGNISPE